MPPSGLDEALECLQAFGDHRIVDGPSVAERTGEHQRSDARPGLARKRAVLLLAMRAEEFEPALDGLLPLRLRAIRCLTILRPHEPDRRDHRQRNTDRSNRQLVRNLHDNVLHIFGKGIPTGISTGSTHRGNIDEPPAASQNRHTTIGQFSSHRIATVNRGESACRKLRRRLSPNPTASRLDDRQLPSDLL